MVKIIPGSTLSTLYCFTYTRNLYFTLTISQTSEYDILCYLLRIMYISMRQITTIPMEENKRLTLDESSEVSSIMRELAGRSLTGTYLYSLCVKPDISTTSASKRWHH